MTVKIFLSKTVDLIPQGIGSKRIADVYSEEKRAFSSLGYHTSNPEECKMDLITTLTNKGESLC